MDVTLLEDKPGPIGNLQAMPTNVSVAVSWAAPTITNGMISGYMISLDGTVVCLFIYCLVKMIPHFSITSAQN